MTRALIPALAAMLAASTGAAQTPACDALPGRSRELAERILASEHPYDCCDDTLAGCLEATPTCALAVRLADNVCRRVAEGQDEVRIRRALSRRARSMVGGGPTAAIDLAAAPAFGPQGAPVTVVVYACARCPFCSRLIPALHEAITTSDLRDDVRMAFRIFPIRGHEGSTEAGLGFAAAADLGAFWPFMLHAYERFDVFTPEVQVDWAEAVGLDREAFLARVADPSTRERLVDAKKEGLVNGVEETPTLFLNGRRWVGDLEAAELLDAIAEEAARVKGETWHAR